MVITCTYILPPGTVNFPLFKLVSMVFYDFINLTQVHNFTVNAQDIFTFRRHPLFTVSFTRPTD